MIKEWIIKYPSIAVSLIVKYTILVRDDTTGEKTHRVGKYSIQVSIRELHNYLIKEAMKEI